MHAQSQIASTLSSAAGMTRLKDLLAQPGGASRTELGRRVCQLFGFLDALGRPQLAGCMKALRALQARGRCPRRPPCPRGSIRCRDWRWSRSPARHVGAQLRYLLVSDHGVLGALGFAASALARAARDAFIGWDADLRSRQLHRVIALSRFLIRPPVRCQNLASKALALCLRRLPGDFQRRYGYLPLLAKMFVEKDRHQGTSLAAANWVCVGQTAGRGRCAPRGVRVPLKSVHLYPLARDWREQLGDVRLSKRLVQSARMQSEQAMASFPEAVQRDRAAVKGYFRMIGRPAESELTPENIVAPHRERTPRRMQGQRTVLCLQDGTDLNFASHGGCAGLGRISKNKGSEGTLGLHMHSLLAVSEEGLLLGVPHIQHDAPDRQAEQGKPLEERKTFRWIRGLRA